MKILPLIPLCIYTTSEFGGVYLGLLQEDLLRLHQAAQLFGSWKHYVVSRDILLDSKYFDTLKYNSYTKIHQKSEALLE